jgi:hypothetical protein
LLQRTRCATVAPGYGRACQISLDGFNDCEAVAYARASRVSPVLAPNYMRKF